MWAKLLHWIASTLLLPILKDLAHDFIQGIKDYMAQKKQEVEDKKTVEENKEKAEEYVNAPSKEAARIKFDNLP
jgi:Sec-independent protein translocase protein TatA